MTENKKELIKLILGHQELETAIFTADDIITRVLGSNGKEN